MPSHQAERPRSGDDRRRSDRSIETRHHDVAMLGVKEGRDPASPAAHGVTVGWAGVTVRPGQGTVVGDVVGLALLAQVEALRVQPLGEARLALVGRRRCGPVGARDGKNGCSVTWRIQNQLNIYGLSGST